MAIFDCTQIPRDGTGSQREKAGAWFLLVLLAMMFVAVSVQAGTQAAWTTDQARISLSIDQALERLCQEINASVLVVGTLPAQQVTLDLANRSAEENLRSILKGYSYVVIYNDPQRSYDSLVEGPSGDAVPPDSHSGPLVPAPSDMAEPVTARERLVARIEQLEAQIESGEADRFYDHWSQHRDSKYIYSHDRELERLHDNLAALDEPSGQL